VRCVSSSLRSGVSQALSTCYGIVFVGEDGELLGSTTVREVMNQVANVIKPLQIAFNEFDVDGSGEVRAAVHALDGGRKERGEFYRQGCGAGCHL
jgi:hypothetical protein